MKPFMLCACVVAVPFSIKKCRSMPTARSLPHTQDSTAVFSFIMGPAAPRARERILRQIQIASQSQLFFIAFFKSCNTKTILSSTE